MQPSAIKKIWKLNTRIINPGGWFWWFWLFFIDNPKNPEKPGQLMILWSIKKDKLIYCNNLPITYDTSHQDKKKRSFCGTVAAWYFDGNKMHDDYLLENCPFTLDEGKLVLKAEGKTNSSFLFKDGKFIVDIERGGKKMHFVAKESKKAPLLVGDNVANFFGGSMSVHSMYMNHLSLGGSIGGRKISGSAYFQKILVNAPPPCWYWGIFQYKDGSHLKYFNTYAGRAILKDNLIDPQLKTPSASITQDLNFFDAKRGLSEHFKNLTIVPKRSGKNWVHEIIGENEEYTIEVLAKTYSHSCWHFRKNVSFLPLMSNFKYNEYPAMIQKVKLKNKKTREELLYGKAVGNIEQAWGLLL
ncbi:MAG: hypothetical protein JW727_05335 [Candidatus Aenigmarchaeota archaeon]|nr:hypothetical protein [Candidatus Aenigmarchaeota archaeon]